MCQSQCLYFFDFLLLFLLSFFFAKSFLDLYDFAYLLLLFSFQFP